tara:strand:+ start:10913 stop:12229 length:1317 start_codon:yes stop_codon:yes gene_type:complete
VKVSSSSSLTPIISEEEFLSLLEKECQEFFKILHFLDDPTLTYSKLYYFTLLQESEKLESFTDDYGARSNLKWLYFAELVACVRNFSIAGFHLHHVIVRYSDYLGQERDGIRKDFEAKSQEVLDYFSQALIRFRKALRSEARLHGIKLKEASHPVEKWRVNTTPQLPFTISSDEESDEKEKIIFVAQSYRRLVKSFKGHRLHTKIKTQKLEEIIPSKINETIISEFEGHLHTLQSAYDTHLKGSKTEKQNGWIATMRGLTAIPMHLFEFARWLVHFYERHENNVRQSDVKKRISELVDNEKLRWSIINFAMHFCNRYLSEGNNVAERILSFYVTPVSYRLPLPNPQGFHARPATYVTLVIQEHGTDVFLVVGKRKFSCRSVLDLLEAGGLLADRKAKTVVFEGDRRVLEDLKILADHNYCEDQEIPQKLNYLRILRNL